VDNPEQAVTTADDLVTRLIAERGYPTGDYDDQLPNLSVEHARTLSHYRDAHEISTRSANGEASTEDLRQALVHYRALFADLLGTEPVKTDDLPGTPTARTVDTTATSTPIAENNVAGGPAQRTDDDADTDRTPVTSTGPATDTTESEPGVARTRPDATNR